MEGSQPRETPMRFFYRCRRRRDHTGRPTAMRRADVSDRTHDYAFIAAILIRACSRPATGWSGQHDLWQNYPAYRYRNHSSLKKMSGRYRAKRPLDISVLPTNGAKRSFRKASLILQLLADHTAASRHLDPGCAVQKRITSLSRAGMSKGA